MYLIVLINKIDSYYETYSLIHKMNSFIKIVCFILFTITILSNDLMVNLLFVDVLVILILLTKIPLAIYIEIAIRFKYVLLISFIISLVSTLSLTFSFVLVIKIILIVWYLFVITLTTSQSEIIYSLSIIFYPLKILKINEKKLALFMSFALRFIPLYFNQSSKVLKSCKSRMNKPNIIIDLKAIIPSLRLTIKKTIDIKTMMEIRLYNVNVRRSNYRFNKVKFFDIIVLVIHITLLVLRFEV